jgi:hypothetical protein
MQHNSDEQWYKEVKIIEPNIDLIMNEVCQTLEFNWWQMGKEEYYKT